MRKTSELNSEPFLKEKNNQNSVLNHFRNRKKLGIPFQTIFGREKNLGKYNFC
jgi:hypothetical protein